MAPQEPTIELQGTLVGSKTLDLRPDHPMSVPTERSAPDAREQLTRLPSFKIKGLLRRLKGF